MLFILFLLVVSAIICFSMVVTHRDLASRQGRIGWAVLYTILIILIQGLASDTIFYEHHARAAEALYICESELPRNKKCIITAIPESE